MSNLSTAEFLSLLTTGYISGLSISAGFILSAIFHLYVKHKKGRLREVIWIATLVISMIGVTLAPVFMIAVLVFGSDPDGPMFWWRMIVFVMGAFGGAVFSFVCAYLIDRAARNGTLLSLLQERSRERR